MKRLSIFFVFLLVTATALYTIAADKGFAADKSVPHTDYKAELSGQKEVPAVQPAPGEAQPTGEATFELSRPEIKGGGAGGAGETGAAGPAGGAGETGVAGSAGGKAKDGNYYSGIPKTGQSSGSAAGGTAGDVLHYKLNVKDIENVTAAHLHMGKKGTPTAEGPVIAPLYTGPQKTGTFSGTLSEGTLTSKDLKGPMSGKSIQDLAKLMDKGEVYVNVHTAQHPAGEIRGEVAPE